MLTRGCGKDYKKTEKRKQEHEKDVNLRPELYMLIEAAAAGRREFTVGPLARIKPSSRQH